MAAENGQNDPDDGPRMLPSLDPSSSLGKELRQTIARLRFARVDNAIQDMAQEVLQGRKSARDLLFLPEMRQYEQRAAASLQEYFNELTENQREALLREGRIPYNG